VASTKGIWEAHRGCAVLAGALLIHENLVSNRAKEIILAKIQSLARADEDPPDSAKETPRSLFTDRLLKEVGISAQDPKEIGHDVIYSVYVLNTLDVLRIDPWESLLEGLITLVRSVKTQDLDGSRSMESTKTVLWSPQRK
jgi:hypothetical protein